MIDFKSLETQLGLEEGFLSAEHEKKESVKVDLSKLKVMPKEDFDRMQGNIQVEVDTKVASIKEAIETATKEKEAKRIKKEFGIEVEGKDLTNVIEAFKAKTLAEANIEPEKQIQTLTSDFNALKEQLTAKEQAVLDLEKEKETIHFTYKEKENQTFIEKTLRGEFKKYEGKLNVSENDFIDLYKLRNTAKVEDGKIRYYDGEEVIKNDRRDPVDTTYQVENFLKSGNYFKEAQGGRGEGDNLEGGATSLEYFNKQMIEKGVSLNGDVYNKELNAAMTSKSVVL